LRQVAHTLRKIVRRKSDLVGRIGGEEFIVLLPDSDLQAARKVAESIRENILALKMEHAASPVVPYVSISAGASAGRIRNHGDIRNLLECADEALYKAKGEGRNRVETVNTGEVPE
jgi:diguanylate cyclase (GGDEF)-like protein